MTTVCGPKAKVATFEGGGDDMDLPLKRLSSLEMFKDLRFFGSEKQVVPTWDLTYPCRIAFKGSWEDDFSFSIGGIC